MEIKGGSLNLILKKGVQHSKIMLILISVDINEVEIFK